MSTVPQSKIASLLVACKHPVNGQVHYVSPGCIGLRGKLTFTPLQEDSLAFIDDATAIKYAVKALRQLKRGYFVCIVSYGQKVL